MKKLLLAIGMAIGSVYAHQIEIDGATICVQTYHRASQENTELWSIAGKHSVFVKQLISANIMPIKLMVTNTSSKVMLMSGTSWRDVPVVALDDVVKIIMPEISRCRSAWGYAAASISMAACAADAGYAWWHAEGDRGVVARFRPRAYFFSAISAGAGVLSYVSYFMHKKQWQGMQKTAFAYLHKNTLADEQEIEPGQTRSFWVFVPAALQTQTGVLQVGFKGEDSFSAVQIEVPSLELALSPSVYY